MPPTQRPQDLVFTLFGEYLLPRPGAAWVGSVIALLQPFDLSEGAIRTVLSRMTRKGWLAAERVGRHSFYDLTPRGRRLLEEGRARIHHPSWADSWDGRWLLLAYSIPEDIRSARDRLRDRLAWLGFGSLGNGLWISPNDVGTEVRDLAEQMDIGRHIECFRAERVGPEPLEDLVKRCWDLPAINAKYRRFIRQWSRQLDRCTDRLNAGEMPDEECYSMRFDLIHEFRAFPLEDPYLPHTLLPEGWAGEEATALFHTLHDLLVGPADAYVDWVMEDAPEAPELAPDRAIG